MHVTSGDASYLRRCPRVLQRTVVPLAALLFASACSAPVDPGPGTNATVPAAPTELTATAGHRSATVGFVVGDDGGAPITNHEYSLDDGATWQPFDPAAVVGPATVGGLVNGASYALRVRARNVVGAGAASGAVVVAPVSHNLIVSAGGPDFDEGRTVRTFPDGSALVGGHFVGTITFGSASLTLTSGGTRGGFVARLGADGAWGWAAAIDAENVLVHALDTFPDGSGIVTGRVLGSAAFGGTTVEDTGSWRGFVARIGPGGAWTWVSVADGTSASAGGPSILSVTALSDGGALVGGGFFGSATFGALEITSAGSSDGFVARIGPAGTWSWLAQVTGTQGVAASDVHAYADGSAVVAGTFRGTTTIGGTTFVADTIDQAYVAKISPSGAWLWAARAVGAGTTVRGYHVAALPDGGAMFVGQTVGTTTFGAVPPVPHSGSGGWDLVVARIDGSGNWLWATPAGGADFIMELGASRPLADGSLLVAGAFRGTFTFGDRPAIEADGWKDDVFVAKIGPSGTWQWATRAGSDEFDGAYAVAALADGSAILTGYYSGTLDVAGRAISSVVGSRDVFVVRIDEDGGW